MAKVLPASPSRRINEQIDPYIPNVGKPTLGENEVNRGNQIASDTKPQTIGLQDIDDAIFYYFNNIIQPIITQKGIVTKVPVTYASQERWAAVQKEGYWRDKNGKVMYPYIMLQRTGFEKNRDLGNKLDGNNVHNFIASKSRYNSKNQYSKFKVLNNTIPSEKFYLTPVPDYINLTYDCVVLTNFMYENNKIVEAIEFASDSYWGDKNHFQFRTYIDNFDSTIEYEAGEERVVKTGMSLTLYGYIIPDSLNKSKATSGKKLFFSKSTISITAETVKNINNIRAGEL